jgi:chorismate--pyruvate lyase
MRAVRTSQFHSSRSPDRQQGWLPHAWRAPRDLRCALSDRASLTRRLQAQYADFRVVPVTRALKAPFADEIHTLHVRAKTRAYVREVVLVGDGNARIFAHSALARSSLNGGWNGIARLGNRSLGEALFTNPRIQRLGLTFRRLDARHPLYRAARHHTATCARQLWARRSVFCLHGRPLLVTEVFLPPA